MKKLAAILLTVLLLSVLCACSGTYQTVNLQEPMDLSADGLVDETVISQIMEENAIAVFRGVSNGYAYEWTVFGSDIKEPHSVNFAVEIDQTAPQEISLDFTQNETFGFPALLSVTLPEYWETQSAAAYRDGTPVASVSLTGSTGTVLNISTDGSLGPVTVRPDEPVKAEPQAEEKQETRSVPMQERASAEEMEVQEPVDTAPAEKNMQQDDYLSAVSGGEETVYSDGKDKYLTDPTPEGKPKPVEPEDQEVDTSKTLTCTFSIECSTIINNLDMLDADKLEMVPSGGTVLPTVTVAFYEGESVFDVLQRVCRGQGIHLESSWTPIYNSAYIEGIHNLYEFDCGSLSGWMYSVNGWYPNYGCSRYLLKQGDMVQWRYTCDLGSDIGGYNAIGG